MTDTDHTVTAAPASGVTDPDQIPFQPISQVLWVDARALSANDWNPNRQAPPEHKLLKQSLIEDGWTQPIVVREHDGGARLEIVDGFHRWKLATNDKEVAALTTFDGRVHVPIVVLAETSDTEARASTIRHNRARGTHLVLRMADIVAKLVQDGMTSEEIQQQLGMDEEEVDRLLDRGNMLLRGGRETGTFGNAWTV